MPVTTKAPRAPRTKCYIHEMQRPMELPYEPHKYHVCWICHARLLEMAKASFRFELHHQVVTISIQPEVQKGVA